MALLAAFALGLWGTILRPPAHEVIGAVVARPAPDMLLVRHEAVAPLGMGAMELMAVFGDPAIIEAAALAPGDRVRLAVRAEGDRIRLIRVEKLR